MKLRILDISESGTDIDFSEEIAIEGDCDQEVPVEASLRAYIDGKEVYITGKITTGINVQCSRCLEQFRSVIDADVNITYLPGDGTVKTEDNKELAEEELNVSYYAGDSIDISNLVSELVAVNIPIKPLCSDDCKGLCTKCGVNLSEEHCDCKEEMIDERWMILKKLKNERKD